MAEINRPRKKGIPVWVMLLALIVLALLVWYFLSHRNRPAAPDNVTTLELSALSQAGWRQPRGIEFQPMDADVQLRGSILRFGVKKSRGAATYY